ncbi:uncharacterized protein LOC135435548 [Drosophila montana]|uniref:uncharacterized protein LOC135435548 n=1 Tax=Drosophila montana TaxID=40370 RepID=UPI00313DE95D
MEQLTELEPELEPQPKNSYDAASSWPLEPELDTAAGDPMVTIFQRDHVVVVSEDDEQCQCGCRLDELDRVIGQQCDGEHFKANWFTNWFTNWFVCRTCQEHYNHFPLASPANAN